MIKNFYPTPPKLISKMVAKIKVHPSKILEPSAGKGDIIDAMSKEYYESRWSPTHKYPSSSFAAIEIDETLQATLRGKGIKVLDTDFLEYSGPDKFDLIIGNPPFDDGDKHLLKAIDILYAGQIIFLLNAETLKNPYSNTRKLLVQKLEKIGAEVEYIQGAFKNAERPAGVEVALVNITVERRIEDDLFKGADDKAEDVKVSMERDWEVSTGRTIEELVAEYNEIIRIGQETILAYYKNYPKIGQYLYLNEKDSSHIKDLTSAVQEQVNSMIVAVRVDFWRRTLDLKEVRSRLTEKKQKEFEYQLTAHCNMDFTESNIRQFVLNLMGGFEKTLTEAVVDIFDMFTVRHSFSNGLYDENIHYFNGWKTNSAFKVGRRVIIPIYAGYEYGPFMDIMGKKWDLRYDAEPKLRDIDIVMNYFDGLGSYTSMADAIKNAFAHGQSSKIVSEYFTITCYKKGTIHLTFNSEDILRRFNVVACRGKEWLPHDYGNKPYEKMTEEEKSVVDSFEGAFSYGTNLNKELFDGRANLNRRLHYEMSGV